MTYSQAVQYINSFLVFGSKPGLERISNLLNLLGNPEKQLKFIHVAGTNGKGSVCAYLSSMLERSGKKVGQFTSPYVLDFAERFRINGENIPHSELARITEKVKAVVDTIGDELYPTEFELITAIGYLYFLENGCDVVVLEVGLGGLYDSTNTIDTPLCSVICSISLDHTKILGDTVEKIAVQKAGIIKPDGNTVVYPIQPGDVHKVFANTAKEKRNRLIIPDISKLGIIDEQLSGTTASYGDITFKPAMAGNVQPINAITAIEAVKAAYPDIDNDSFINGIAAAKIPARCEVVDPTRPIIMDGAHNPDGVLALKSLLTKFVNKPITAVLGMMADKDIDTVLSEMAECFDKIYTVTVDNPRAITAEELKKKVIAHGKSDDDVTAFDSVSDAITHALSEDNALCICGSFYMMTEAYKYVK